ncbi:MAG: fatty acid desaturase [Myxococcales bacterium]|nr:fatty acid desaturase [Myxococcales bacterium]
MSSDGSTFAATREFAQEQLARSWFHVLTTLAVLTASIAVAAAAPWWPVRWLGSLIEALTMLRVFILFHDHMHGALLRSSPVAIALFRVVGLLLLTPARIWAETHNFHHAHTAKLGSPPTGTFAFWSVERWREASWRERLLYRLERHPVTMLFGHLLVFFIGISLWSFCTNPRRYKASGLAIAMHLGLSVCVWMAFGTELYLATMLVPFFIACAAGSYLFYAQHNAPGIELREADSWTHAAGALHGSSYMATGAVAAWFTGNIGFHHVHHLNVRIPFYRLPEAMKAIPELQAPIVTTLKPRDVLACLRLALWDHAEGRLVPFSAVR